MPKAMSMVTIFTYNQFALSYAQSNAKAIYSRPQHNASNHKNNISDCSPHMPLYAGRELPGRAAGGGGGMYEPIRQNLQRLILCSRRRMQSYILANQKLSKARAFDSSQFAAEGTVLFLRLQYKTRTPERLPVNRFRLVVRADKAKPTKINSLQ